jgi:hypothetical protein
LASRVVQLEVRRLARQQSLNPGPKRSHPSSLGKPLIVNNECATGFPDTVVFYISLCECDEFLTILN